MAWLDRLFPFGFLALGLYGCVHMVREAKAAVSSIRQGTPFMAWPLWPRRPAPAQVHRYPLTEPQKASCRVVLAALEACGLVIPNELDFDDFVDTAEIVCIDDGEIYDVACVLSNHAERRNRPFARMAFFINQVEFFEEDALRLAHEFARLAGIRSDIDNLSVELGSQIPGSLNKNAELCFELRGQPHRVPFVLLSKYLPFDLMEKLSEVFASHQTDKRFVGGYFDAVVMVSFIDSDQLKALVEAFGGDPPWFEPLH
ncbi:MAG: hypothetical protein ACR2PM_12400 [Hyphomicrobiales bacterium]